jgi:hypothetical protein
MYESPRGQANHATNTQIDSQAPYLSISVVKMHDEW